MRTAQHHRDGDPADGPPLLLVGADVRTLDPAQPSARAILLRRRRLAWVGGDPAEAPPGHHRVVDVSGTVVQPAYVNAHTHLTALGLTLGALDLAVARSLDDCLAVLRAAVDVTPDHVVWGVGWDETGWPEHRPPTAEEVSEAAAGRPVLLSRSDGHCVVVDRRSLTALPLARARGVERGPGGAPTGVLRQEAAQVAQSWFRAQMPDATLSGARDVVARELAAAGVASAHEMGGPHRMGAEDFDAWATGEWPIEVVPYWGDMDLDFVTERGLRRVGGSLLLDGTIGSHSAALAAPYADRPGSGHLYHDTADLAEFALEATRKGVQVALHAIGDRAVAQAVAVFAQVADVVGPEQLRRSAHRLEYAAMVGAQDLARLVSLGLVVSAQPAGDLSLGARGGAYEQRLGPGRARAANPLGRLAAAGVPLAFGADDVNALSPAAAIRAATTHTHEELRMTTADAVEAATVGGRAAARQPNVGRIVAGHRADLAVFDGDPLGEGVRCVATIVAGRITHGRDRLLRG